MHSSKKMLLNIMCRWCLLSVHDLSVINSVSMCLCVCSKHKGSGETEETVSLWGAHRAVRETGEQEISRQSAKGSNDGKTECSGDSEKGKKKYVELPQGSRRGDNMFLNLEKWIEEKKKFQIQILKTGYYERPQSIRLIQPFVNLFFLKMICSCKGYFEGYWLTH